MTRPAGMFPFAPIQFELEARFTEIDCVDDLGHPAFVAAGDQTRSAEVLGVSRRAVNRWANGQLLRPEMADHCATRLGVWPNQLWPDWDQVHERLEAERQASARRRRDSNVARCRAQRAAAA